MCCECKEADDNANRYDDNATSEDDWATPEDDNATTAECVNTNGAASGRGAIPGAMGRFHNCDAIAQILVMHEAFDTPETLAQYCEYFGRYADDDDFTVNEMCCGCKVADDWATPEDHNAMPADDNATPAVDNATSADDWATPEDDNATTAECVNTDGAASCSSHSSISRCSWVRENAPEGYSECLANQRRYICEDGYYDDNDFTAKDMCCECKEADDNATAEDDNATPEDDNATTAECVNTNGAASGRGAIPGAMGRFHNCDAIAQIVVMREAFGSPETPAQYCEYF